jgi:hypothetical protein
MVLSCLSSIGGRQPFRKIERNAHERRCKLPGNGIVVPTTRKGGL